MTTSTIVTVFILGIVLVIRNLTHGIILVAFPLFSPVKLEVSNLRGLPCSTNHRYLWARRKHLIRLFTKSSAPIRSLS